MHFWNDLGLFAASPNFSSLQNIVTPFSPKPSSWIFIQPSKIDFRKRRTSAILCGWHKAVIKPRCLLRVFSFSFEKSVFDRISGNLLLRHLVTESTAFWGPLCLDSAQREGVNLFEVDTTGPWCILMCLHIDAQDIAKLKQGIFHQGHETLSSRSFAKDWSQFELSNVTPDADTAKNCQLKNVISQ